MYINMYIYICICMYMYTYIYIHIYRIYTEFQYAEYCNTT